MPHVLAKAQRTLGHHAIAYSMSPSSYRYTADIQLDTSTGIHDKLKAVTNIFRFAATFDIFHFYFGNSLAGNRLYDVRFLKKLGKKIFFYFCGCDIRDSKEVIAKYEFSGCKDCWPMLCSANRDRAYDVAVELADGIFVSTPDLLDFVPGSIWLPPPIDLQALDELSRKIDYKQDTGKIVVAHAPTSRMIKGSRYVIEAVEALQRESYNIELKLIENMPYEAALAEYVKADIVIDQLLIGWYGLVSIEMMALRKPVICYIREDLRQYVSDEIPLISANILNLKDVLRSLIERPDSWKSQGERGRKYVEKYHEAGKVAEMALEMYKKCRR